MHIFKTFVLTLVISSAMFMLIMTFVFREPLIPDIAPALTGGVGAGVALAFLTWKKQGKKA